MEGSRQLTETDNLFEGARLEAGVGGAAFEVAETSASPISAENVAARGPKGRRSRYGGGGAAFTIAEFAGFWANVRVCVNIRKALRLGAYALAFMLSLDSVAAKIERAHEHGRLLDQELDAWIKETPYALSRKVNSDFTRHSVMISITTPPPLQRWSLLFGDAIHNLRSALDHLVYAISIHEFNADPPPNGGRCAFVINDSPNDFKSKHWHIADLSLPVRQAIESVQPYNRKHPILPPLLAVLRDFDDADKHRLIKVVMQRPVEFEITATGPGLRAEDQHFESPYVDLVDGAEIAWVTTKRPTPHLQLNGRVTATIAVEHPPGPGLDGIERTGIERLLLEDLLPEVREVVRQISAAVS